MAMLINNKNKLYVDQIDMKTNDYLNNVLSDELKDYQPGIFTQLYDSLIGIDNSKPKIRDTFYNFSSEDDTPYYKLNDDMIKIIKMAKEYFDKAGIKVDEYNGRISFSSTQYNSTEIHISPFDIHRDNDEMYRCNTCIFYIEKDNKLRGGNLDIYLDYSFLNSVGLENPKPLELGIQSGQVVVFDGDLYHCPQPCGGFGYRNTIIVNLTTKSD
jgi:hypothetical protein